MINLSEKQRQIVDHLDGAVLVKAGPGSGKTRVIIERIKKLLLTKKRCKILALTFSNLAADEMKNRILDDSAMIDFANNVTVSTIHAFALDMVQTRGNLIGLNPDMVLFENEDDRKNILRNVFINDPQFQTVLAKKINPDKFLINCLNIISTQKKQFVFPELCKYGDLFPSVYKEYNEQLLRQNAMDFDDILVYAYHILTENPGVVKLYTSLYKYICVDEAQDLNYAQYEVLKTLCGDTYKNIMLVGDENQSIYGFNGSDSSLMSIRFVNDFQPVQYVLNENFRSAKKIVTYADSLKKGNTITNYVYEGELSLFAFNNEHDEASFIFQKIQKLLKKGHQDIEGSLKYDDFAVIGRNKYVLASVEKMLSEQSIPFFYKKITSGIDNESDYMKTFDLGIRILINPFDEIHWNELCRITGANINKNGNTTYDLLKDALIGSYFPLFDALQIAASEDFDFNKVLSNIREHISPDFTEDDRYFILNDTEQWEKHWKKYTSQVQREYRSLLSFRNYISLGKTQDITSEKGVALLSAHMSKGLQYNVVFIAGLTEGTFPDYRAIKAGDIQLEQEKNNMYVAVTRAKRLCYLTYPKIKLMPWGDYKTQYPSRYVRDIEVGEDL